jgi:hypothetical protein
METKRRLIAAVIFLKLKMKKNGENTCTGRAEGCQRAY